MKLSKTDSLFLYGLLFHLVAKNETGLAPHVEDQVSDFLDELTKSILEGESSPEVVDEDGEEDDDDEDEDVDEEDEESIEADEVVDPIDVEGLPALRVTQGDKKHSLEFDASSDPDCVDVLVDDDQSYEAIALQIVANTLILHTRDDERRYDFDKLPKKWSKFFVSGRVYAFQREDE